MWTRLRLQSHVSRSFADADAFWALATLCHFMVSLFHHNMTGQRWQKPGGRMCWVGDVVYVFCNVYFIIYLSNFFNIILYQACINFGCCFFLFFCRWLIFSSWNFRASHRIVIAHVSMSGTHDVYICRAAFPFDLGRIPVLAAAAQHELYGSLLSQKMTLDRGYRDRESSIRWSSGPSPM